MSRRPPSSTRTDTRFPCPTLFRSLASVPAHELGARAVTAALERAGVPGDDVGEVVMGCIAQNGPDAYNARRVALAAGLHPRIPAFTVNRLCGSGLQALWRSEEHTSELQSLLRISYAVFCVKQNKQ